MSLEQVLGIVRRRQGRTIEIESLHFNPEVPDTETSVLVVCMRAFLRPLPQPRWEGLRTRLELQASDSVRASCARRCDVPALPGNVALVTCRRHKNVTDRN